MVWGGGKISLLRAYRGPNLSEQACPAAAPFLREECVMQGRRYRDRRGCLIFVDQGRHLYWPEDKRGFFIFRRPKRYEHMPVSRRYDTFDEAQAELDARAKKHVWQESE